jgi:gliding motility-associated-like protein
MRKYLLLFMFINSINNLSAQCNYSFNILNNDTIICASTPIQLSTTTTGNTPNNPVYNWTPTIGLSNPNAANPIAITNNATTYTCTVSSLIGNNLIIDGDFELADNSFTSTYIQSPTGTTASGTYSILDNPSNASTSFSPCNDHTTSGVNMLVVNSSTVANSPFWCRTVNLTPNTDYVFSMWATNIGNVNLSRLFVTVNGSQVNPTTFVVSPNCNWQEITFTWNSGTLSSADFCIVNQNTSATGNDFAVDDISLFELCTQTDAVFVDVYNPVNIISVIDSFCFEDSFFVAGDWQRLPGIYYDTIKAQTTGCDSIITETVLTIIQVIQFNFGLDRSICPGDSVLIKFEQPDITYLWNTGDTTEGIYVKTAGTYFLTTTSLDGCLTSDTVDVIVEAAPEIIFSEDTLICRDGTLDIFVANLDNYTYQWQDNSTDSSFTATAPGTYTVVVSNSNFSCPNVGTITITETPPLLFDLGQDTAICESIPLEISLNVADAISYEWQNGSTENTYIVDSEERIWVDIYDIRDCKFSDTLEVTFRPVPEEILALPRDTVICKNGFITLRPFALNATDYLWEGEAAYFGQNNRSDTSFVVTFPGTYAFTASNLCGGVTQFVDVTEADCGCYPFVPNGFTPNDDGINDVFMVYANCEIQDYELLIFDRWGNKVFQSTDVTFGWDGTIQGNIRNAGVYVWQMIYKALDENGEVTEKQTTGSITLVR